MTDSERCEACVLAGQPEEYQGRPCVIRGHEDIDALISLLRSELAEAREHMQVFVDNYRGNWYATEDDEGDSLKTLGTRMTAFLARSESNEGKG